MTFSHLPSSARLHAEISDIREYLSKVDEYNKQMSIRFAVIEDTVKSLVSRVEQLEKRFSELQP